VDDLKKIKSKGPSRISVESIDPLLAKGSSYAAVAPITVLPSGLSCKGELWLTTNGTTKNATSGMVPFTSTGASQSVHFPVTMPSAAGEFMVYLDVYADSLLIGSYIATENVVIPGVEIGPISWD